MISVHQSLLTPLPATAAVTSPFHAFGMNGKGVDNLFVFLMTFSYFQVPMEHQGRVLKWGIAGAILMRGVMIVFGVAVSPLPAPQQDTPEL